MSGLGVRRAESDDVEAVSALAGTRPYAAKWSARELGQELDRLDSIFLVADDGGPVRGYALARVVGGDCQLLDLAAAEDGTGIGRGLMAALLTAAKGRGCAKVTFEASAANARALVFYEKAGARVVGRRPKFYYDGSDALLMDLDIP
jgi:ribosomal protein S18 acetylase RimI-like enzyme